MLVLSVFLKVLLSLFFILELNDGQNSFTLLILSLKIADGIAYSLNVTDFVHISFKIADYVYISFCIFYVLLFNQCFDSAFA